MDSYLVEAYRYLRDNAKPVSQRDAADLAKVRAFEPPSRAHLKRHRRHLTHGEGNYVPAPRPLPPTSRATLEKRMSNQFFKEQMALLGGSRTVAPAPEPYVRPRETWYYVPHAGRTELYPEPKPFAFMSEERARSIVRDHLVALGRAGLDVDMFLILDIFGSYECYGKALVK